MIKNKLSDIIASQLPEHITETPDYSNFVEFLQAYYKYLETQKVYRNIETVRDVETTLDTFIELLKNEYAVEYPEFAKDRFFLKNTGHVSVAHGSEQSYKFLFRQMFKKEVDIRYPKDQILTLSNSLWVQDISFFAKVTAGEAAKLENNFIQIDTVVNGINTKNKVYVKRVEFVETTENTYEIFISKDYYGAILVGDTISYDGVFATVIPTTVSIKVVKAGYGFSVGQVFNVESGTGSGLSFKVTEVTLVGGIKACQIISYGINYKTTFAFDLPSSVILQDNVEIDGYKISSTSTQQRFYDSGIITKQNYYSSSYSNDYVGTVVADFSSLTVPSSIEINTARLQVNLGTVARYQGYYSKSTGLVSSPDSIIQDSYYYQDFSYVLRIDEAFETYRDVVLSLLHPTGRQMFAEYVIDNFYELEYSIVEPVFKILLPLYSGIPTVVTMLDRLSYVLQKLVQSEQVILDSIAKAVTRPIASETTIEDVKRWLFESAKASSVTPTATDTFLFDAPKFSDTIPTDALNYLLQTSKASSVTPTATDTFVFAAPKSSTLSTPTDISYWNFAALKDSSVTPTATDTFVFAAPKASSVTQISAPSWVFETTKASTLSAPTDVDTFAYNKLVGLSSTIRNLLTYTNDLTNAYWVKAAASITANATTAPDGNSNAFKLVEDTSATTQHSVRGSSLAYTAPGTFSCYAKAGERSWILLTMSGSGSSAYFDLTNGLVGSTVDCTTTINSVGGGWYRCTMTDTSGITAFPIITLANANNGSSYTGDGTSGVYIWAPQFELASSATLYQGVAASGVLVEAAAVRNLLTHTEQFDNAAWIALNTTTLSDVTTAPDNTTFADKLIANSTSSVHVTRQNKPVIIGLNYALSIYAKKAEYNYIKLLASNALGDIGTIFNLDTGSIHLNDSGVVSSILSVGGGWYRCIIFVTAASTNLGGLYPYVVNNSIQTSFAGDGTSGIYIWGAQLELGSNVTTYQRIGNAATATDSLAVPVDTSSFLFAAPKASSVTPTATDTFVFSSPKASSVTPTDASPFLFAAPKASSVTPTDNDTFSYNKLLGLTSTIRNLLTYTEDLTQWSTSGLTPTITNSATVTAPNGAYTADSIIYPVSANGSAIVYSNFTGSGAINTLYSGSIYLKANGYNFARVAFDNSAFASTATGCVVNLTTGVITSTLNGSKCTINDAGNGWYRVTITATSDADGGQFVFALSQQNTANDGTLTPNGTSGIYAWGGQVELGGTTTVYQGVAASGVLVEAASVRNLIKYSEQFDNVANWNPYNASVTADAITAPDGTLSADKLFENSVVGVEHYIEASPSTATNQTYTQSVYVKAAETSGFIMMAAHVGASFATSEAVFSISGGVVVAGVFGALITSSSVLSVGNGWYRCAITYTLNGTVTFHRQRIYPRQSGLYAGDGTSGIYVWGAQTEVGSNPTTYQRIGSTVNSAESLAVPVDSSLFTFAKSQASTLSSPTDANIYSLNRLIAPAVNSYAAYANDFTNLGWTTTSASVTANTIAAPDSSVTADTVTDTGSSGFMLARGLFGSFQTTIGNTYTTSFYLKAGTRTWVGVRMDANSAYAGSSSVAYFNLSTGTIGTVTVGLTARIENYGNGWYRCFVTRAATSTFTSSGFILTTADNILLADTAPGSYVYAWNADVREIDPVVATDAPSFVFATPKSSTISAPTDALNYLLQTPKASSVTPTDNDTFVFAAPKSSTLSSPTDANTYSLNKLVAPAVNAYAAYANDFTNNAGWNFVQITVVANTTAAPDTSLTADTIAEDTTPGNTQHRIYSTFPAVIGNIYTTSFYLKAGTRTWAAIRFSESNIYDVAYFNLSTGTIGTVELGLTARIENYGNGWYRCFVTRAATATSMATGINIAVADNTLGHPGLGSGYYIYAWNGDVREIDQVITTDNDTIDAVKPIGYFDANDIRRNLISYSEQFDAWSSAHADITANTITAPDGTTTADKIVENIDPTVEHYVQINNNIFTNQTYTQSVYVKAAETNTFKLMVVHTGASSSVSLGNFNISAGVITATTSTALITSSSAISVGNGWYRCSITYTLNGTVTLHAQRIYPRISGNYTGDGTSGIYVWGAQTEVGNTTSAYQGIAAGGVIKANSVRNLLRYTQQFDSWINNSALTVTANAMVAPDGTLTADTTTSQTGNTRYIGSSTITIGLTYTYSFYVKPTDPTKNILVFKDGTGGSGSPNLTVVPSSGVNAINVGDGWYRVWNTFTAAATGAANCHIYPQNTDLHGWWGAQLELGETLTPYQGIGSTLGSVINTATLRNLQNYSEGFNNTAAWVLGTGVTITANTGIAPDFTQTAYTLSGSTNTTFGTSFRNFGIPCTAGLSYTASIFVKTITSTTVKLRLRTSASGTPDDVITSTLTPTSSWQRFFVTIPITVTDDKLTLHVGATDGDILIWGGQIEVGVQPSAYQRIGSTNNATDSLAFPSDNLNILTSRPVASSLTTPTDTQTFITGKGVSSTQINTDGGNVYFNAYSAEPYFVDMSYLQATQSF